MRTALVRRTVLTASAVSLTLLATACGSEKAETKADAKPAAGASTAPSPAAPVVKGKTDAELGALILTQADLPDHEVKQPTPADLAESTSDKPECLSLVKAQSLAPAGTTVGAARVKALTKATRGKDAAAGASEDEKAKAMMEALRGSQVDFVTLASYEGKGAQEAFATYKTAGAACAGGYTAGTAGQADASLKITKVGPGAAVTAGDEALSYTLTADVEGAPMNMELAFVRKGNTLAIFSAHSLGGTAKQPKAVIEAQVKKLG
ncbi:hypothetical protein [Streptomyces sp. NPDC051567]|uniref:hypothetical protein n=1 Tax=Streptomyces sp. NPDC051567 TaxID=3365660 RepID=UPI0037AE2DDE